MNELKKDDEIFCPECGKQIKRKAVICVHCGVQVGELKTLIKKEDEKIKVPVKSKLTAVLLSAFLGYWSWLYTYKKNHAKFWISLGVILAIIIIIFVLVIIVINYNAALFENYGTWIWLFWLMCNGGIWLWALIDNATKSDSFYDNYPNG